MRARSNSTLALVAVVGMLATGCKKAGSTPTQSDSTAAPGADSSGDPLAELAELERQMQAMGLVVPGDSSGGESLKQSEPIGAGASAASESDGEGSIAEERQAPADDEAPAPVTAPDQYRDDGNQCSDVCDLSVAICDLEVRICSMSAKHDGDSAYANACVRANDDCVVANDACDRCAG